MADGAVTADLASSPPTEFGWSVQLRDAGVDATGTVVLLQVPRRVIQCDASAEVTFELPWAKKEEREDEADIPWLLTQEVLHILDEIESTLLEDREEGLLHAEVCASEPALATCRRLAVKIAPWLARSSERKWAAFGEDTGGVSLVLRSVLTNRRVDYRISADGLHISAVHIDENLSAKSVPRMVDDRTGLRESAAWVHSRP